MNTFIDLGLVGVLLLASLIYALLALGPQSWRRRLTRALGMESPAATSAGSCGGCDGCGSESAAPQVPGEIKIPVAKIGRR